MSLTIGTFCSGIGAPEVAAAAWFRPLWFSEIEPFPCAVLAHHYPGIPNLGDMTAPDFVERIAAVGLPDVVVAGLPCQPFSVAGLRKGEADPRNLTARFVEIADAVDDLRRDLEKPPTWWLVENVPGLLFDRGNAFGALVGGMVGSDAALVPVGRWENAGVADGPRRCAAWRVLDAQHFGVAQRRRRVFLLFVGGAGARACADALLPLADRLCGSSPPRPEAGQVAPTVPARGLGGGGLGTDFEFDGWAAPAISPALKARDFKGPSSDGDGDGAPLIVHPLRSEGFDASEDGTGRRTPLVPVAFSSKDHGADADVDLSPTLRAGGHAASHANAGVPPAVAFGWQNSEHQSDAVSADISPTLDKSKTPAVALGWVVRRLTPRECERLQGFPDDFTNVPWRGKPGAPDGPRYKALGNSMAVPVVRWIMERMRVSMETAE